MNRSRWEEVGSVRDRTVSGARARDSFTLDALSEGVNQYGAGLNHVMVLLCYETHWDRRGVKGRERVLGIGTEIVAVVPRDRIELSTPAFSGLGCAL